MDADAAGRPEWSDRLRREREVRSWSLWEAARRLHVLMREAGERQVPDDEHLRRNWIRWEAGGGISDAYQRYLAELFDTVAMALFPPARPQVVLPSGDVHELLLQLQSSNVDNSTLEGAALTVDRLCSEYPYRKASELLAESRSWLARLVQLIHRPMTLQQRREVQVQAGWLALLVGCVQYDTGDAHASEVTRQHALTLGREAGHAEIMGWAHEMAAWQALTKGNYRGVVATAQAGAEIAGRTGVSVQLAAQEAKAHARMGDWKQAHAALDRGRRLLEPMEWPMNLDHHFVVDPAKYDFYAMDVHRIGGDDALAEHLADEVIRAGTHWDGSERSVMRNAEARITLGTVAARKGDVEAAVDYGLQAISTDRQSLPSLLMTSQELAKAITTVAPDAAVGRDYVDQLRQLGRQSQ